LRGRDLQIASVQEALRGVGRNLMKNHMRQLRAKAIQNGKEKRRNRCMRSCWIDGVAAAVEAGRAV